MENKGALDGIRVLAATQFAAGPICTQVLAQMGAEVIKLERPVTGEPGRKDKSLFAILNANKNSLSINLKAPESKKIMEDLIKNADVLVENFAPGTLERLGYTWEYIHEVNPRMIFCSIKGYSDVSPFRNSPAFDGAIEATGSIVSQTGTVGGPPVNPGVAFADNVSGHYAACGVITALFQRERTGRGQQVRINMQEVMLATSIMNVSYSVVMQKDQSGFKGSLRGVHMAFAGEQCPIDVFPTKPTGGGDDNDYVSINILDQSGPTAWINLCKLMGREDWAADESMYSGKTRLQRKEEIYKEIIKWTTQHEKVEAMQILTSNKIAAGAVLSLRDLCESEYMYENKMLHRFHHPELGDIILMGNPYHLSDTQIEVKAAPKVSSYNDYIYKDVLKYSDADLAALKEKGVI